MFILFSRVCSLKMNTSAFFTLRPRMIFLLFNKFSNVDRDLFSETKAQFFVRFFKNGLCLRRARKNFIISSASFLLYGRNMSVSPPQKIINGFAALLLTTK